MVPLQNLETRNFEGSTIEEAEAKMRDYFGDRGVVLDKSTIRYGGFFGFFQKVKVEIKAAAGGIFDKPRDSVWNFGRVSNNVEPLKNSNLRLQTMNKPDKDVVTDKKTSKSIDQMSNKIEKLEQNLVKILKVMEKSGNQKSQGYPEYFRAFFERLKSNETCDQTIQRLYNLLELDLNEDEKSNQSIVPRALKGIIKERIRIGMDLDSIPPLNDENGERMPKIITMIGPTGVGKTTTLAKLAGKYFKRDIAFISLDIFRVGAGAQLKSYGEILKCPVEQAFDSNEFIEFIEKHKDKEYIFVDTAGRPHNDVVELNNICNYLKDCKNVYKYLVLSATTTYSNLCSVVDGYNRFGFQGLIFTKLDETVVYGPIFSLLCKVKVPLAYTCDGQDVLMNLHLPDVALFIKKLMFPRVDLIESENSQKEWEDSPEIDDREDDLPEPKMMNMRSSHLVKTEKQSSEPVSFKKVYKAPERNLFDKGSTKDMGELTTRLFGSSPAFKKNVKTKGINILLED